MKYLLSLLPILFLFGCSARMGDLTTIATRNIDQSVKYKELSRYVKGKDRVVTSVIGIPLPKRPNFEEATDDAVKKIPNGEYLKNATIKSKFRWWILWSTEEIVILGDVWGEEKANTLIMGSNVNFKKNNTIYTGEIIKIEGERAVVKYQKEGEEKVITKKLSELFVDK